MVRVYSSETGLGGGLTARVIGTSKKGGVFGATYLIILTKVPLFRACCMCYYTRIR
ncbi:hypothetical protein ACP70R_023488 [Stipagrostis hirtigluma subsp. patula]